MLQSEIFQDVCRATWTGDGRFEDANISGEWQQDHLEEEELKLNVIV